LVIFKAYQDKRGNDNLNASLVLIGLLINTNKLFQTKAFIMILTKKMNVDTNDVWESYYLFTQQILSIQKYSQVINLDNPNALELAIKKRIQKSNMSAIY
jgi:hypothetical protein